MRDAKTRDRLVAAGHRLFQVKGDLNLTGPKICIAAEVKSSASINEKFGSIDGLLLAVLEAEIQRYRRFELVMLTEAHPSSPIARVKNFIVRSTTEASAEQIAAGFLFANVAATLEPEKFELRVRTREVLVEIEKTLGDTISAARQLNEIIGTVEPRAAATQIFAGIQKLRLDARLSGETGAFSPFLAGCGRLFGRAVW